MRRIQPVTAGAAVGESESGQLQRSMDLHRQVQQVPGVPQQLGQQRRASSIAAGDDDHLVHAGEEAIHRLRPRQLVDSTAKVLDRRAARYQWLAFHAVAMRAGALTSVAGVDPEISQDIMLQDASSHLEPHMASRSQHRPYRWRDATGRS